MKKKTPVIQLLNQWMLQLYRIPLEGDEIKPQPQNSILVPFRSGFENSLQSPLCLIYYFIQCRWIQWLGHVLRIDQDCIPKTALGDIV